MWIILLKRDTRARSSPVHLTFNGWSKGNLLKAAECWAWDRHPAAERVPLPASPKKSLWELPHSMQSPWKLPFSQANSEVQNQPPTEKAIQIFSLILLNMNYAEWAWSSSYEEGCRTKPFLLSMATQASLSFQNNRWTFRKKPVFKNAERIKWNIKRNMTTSTLNIHCENLTVWFALKTNILVE